MTSNIAGSSGRPRRKRLRHSSPVGGCDFPVDPTVDALGARVFWRPDWHVASIILDSAPAFFRDARPFDPDSLPWSERLTTQDGDYVRAGNAVGIASVHLLMLHGDRRKTANAIVLPLDHQILLRLEAIRWFWSRFFGDVGGQTDVHHLDDHARQRLLLTLRVLDGQVAGASQRIIGNVVLEAPVLRSLEWKDHHARSQLQRLLAEGKALIAGGYRRFLLPDDPRT